MFGRAGATHQSVAQESNLNRPEREQPLTHCVPKHFHKISRGANEFFLYFCLFLLENTFYYAFNYYGTVKRSKK